MKFTLKEKERWCRECDNRFDPEDVKEAVLAFKKELIKYWDIQKYYSDVRLFEKEFNEIFGDFENDSTK